MSLPLPSASSVQASLSSASPASLQEPATRSWRPPRAPQRARPRAPRPTRRPRSRSSRQPRRPSSRACRPARRRRSWRQSPGRHRRRVRGAAIGGAIFGDAGAAAAGGFGAEVGAEIGAVAGVVPELEADHWNFLKLIGQLSASGVGAGAAAGAAAGSFIPVIGTGVGALVGSVVGDIAGATNPPLQDCRYLSEKLCFPAVAPIANNADTNADGVFGLIPGQIDSTFRALPNSTFYQTQGGLNSAWANLWSMLVSWRSPSRSTRTSRRAAWVLTQYYCRKFSARLGHDTSSSMSWESLVSVAGSSSRAAGWLLKLTQWYGDPATFNPTLPFASAMASGAYKVGTGYAPSGITNDPRGVATMRAEFDRCPLDYLYYPIGIEHSGKQFFPTATAHETDVLLTFDGLLLTLAESVVLGLRDITVFHLLVQLSYWWVHCRKLDTRVFPGLSTKNHPNFSRCLALVASQLYGGQASGCPQVPHVATTTVHGEPSWDETAPAPTGATVRIDPGNAVRADSRGSSVDPSSPIGSVSSPTGSSGSVSSPTGSSGASTAGAAGGGDSGEFSWRPLAIIAVGAAVVVAAIRANQPRGPHLRILYSPLRILLLLAARRRQPRRPPTPFAPRRP